MKKYLITIITSIITFNLLSQPLFKATSFDKITFNKAGKSKTAYDTIMPPGFLEDGSNQAIYNMEDQSGFYFGNNSYKLSAVAQEFWIQNTTTVVGCGFVCDKSGSSGGKIIVKIYKMDGIDTTSVNKLPAPNTELAQMTRNISDLYTYKEGLANFFNLNNPITTDVDVAVAIDFFQIKNDKIGLVSTKDGDGGEQEYSWFQTFEGYWYSYLYGAEGMDVDLFMFIIIDNATGCDEFINDVKLSNCYPNPASDNTNIDYELKTSSDVNIYLYCTDGRQVATYKQGKQNPGSYSLNMNLNGIPAGNYYYIIKTDKGATAKALLVR
ncbi:MAG: T9SS type A sorting domain-containing protein [Bacteroidales bacterium]|nr:T9SS type A sorting domain-containing protein [Bacteroidales bacterium]